MNYLIPPNYLDRNGKVYWSRVAPALDGIGKLDALTYDLLAAACQAFSVYRSATDKLKKEGRVITTTTGTVKVNPQMQVEKQAFEMLCRVWKELDIAGKPPIPPADELDDFIAEVK